MAVEHLSWHEIYNDSEERILRPVQSLCGPDCQAILDKKDVDVLCIFDCCYAARSTNDNKPGSGHREFLGAAGKEGMAVADKAPTFTAQLTQHLRDFGTTPFSVAELHLKLARDEKLSIAPCHIIKSEPQRSIILAPLPNANNTGKSLEVRSEVRRNTQEAGSLNADTLERVLLSISLEGSPSKSEVQTKFDAWQKNAPENMKVKFEAIYDGLSTLFLISLPPFEWSQLDGDAAFAFVGLIDGTREKPTIIGREGRNLEGSAKPMRDAITAFAEKRGDSRPPC